MISQSRSHVATTVEHDNRPRGPAGTKPQRSHTILKTNRRVHHALPLGDPTTYPSRGREDVLDLNRAQSTLVVAHALVRKIFIQREALL
jgi:hypothetical protein